MFYLLIKGIILRFKMMIGLKGYIHDEYVISLYIIGFLLSYIGALICVSVGWWIYEWAILGQLNQNQGDTVTALKWSLLLMFPIADLYLMYLKKELKKA
ncbi:hypothetical protein [Bacillus cereus group sp. BfR-BA-01328]|uniref:hypothetical protein n=1 Tax=Bacillus cereus group sp. BfR-BA-01328 TaxID=2920304 RepID=UPI001F5A1020